MIYHYWITRYVPNVARGEFTNIGIVCGADGADWAAEFDIAGVPTPGQLRSDLRELSGWVRWFMGRLEGSSQLTFDESAVSVGWMEHLRARQANAVQFSEPAPIEAETAKDAVALLFPHLVEREPTRRPRSGLTRAGMRSQLRDAYQHDLDLLPGRTLFTHPKVRVGRQRGGFDIGRQDVTKGTVLTNAWAFNVSTLEHLERDIQSWNYLVSRFREDGGDVRFDSQVRHLTGDERLEVVFDPPKKQEEGSWRSEIFEAAKEAWNHADVAAAPYDQYLKDLRSDALALR